MKQLILIGNLGADAEVRNEGGSKFVSLSISDTTRRTGTDGQVYETTEWISATLNGDGGELLKYLKKGTKVFCYGNVTTKIFSSAKDRRMKAGLNLYIREIQLIGAQPDAVPSKLYDSDGVEHPVAKYFYTGAVGTGVLFDRRGTPYQVNPEGWVTCEQPAEPATTETSQNDFTNQDPKDTDDNSSKEGRRNRRRS